MSDTYPYSFGGYSEIGDAEAERLTDREEAMRYPCRYEIPEAMRSRVMVDRGEPVETRYRCGAAVGERCRVPGTTDLLTRQAAHRVRLRDAGRA